MIFYHNSEQEKIARKSKQELEDSGKFNQHIVTQIEAASAYYLAEEYHQQYLTRKKDSRK